MRPPEIIADRFTILHLASSGGMGAVYRAHDRLRGEDVAVKTLFRQSVEESERFAREAEVLAALQHPGIVGHIAHGRTAEGELYLVMEWLEGEDLSQRLAHRALTVDESLALTAQAGGALEAAHAQGVVHRDVKPSNIFLVGGGIERIKILDFGIARLGAAARSSTRTGSMIGTPGYMAPEQARGDRQIDARADVFALGCVLFECLTGRAVFVGSHPMAVLAKILFEQPPRLRDLRPDLPRELDALVARMLAVDPAGRPSRGAAVLAEIEALGVVEGEARSRTRPSLAPTALGAGEQRPLCVILVGPPAPSGGAPNAPTTVAPPPGLAHALRAIVEAVEGRLEPLADGSLVATLWGARTATDQVMKAARCALAMRALLPGVPMALATGRGVIAGRWPVGEAIDRAARLLHARGPGDRPAIRIDEVTAGLLDVRFEVGGSTASLELRGERELVETARTLLGKPTPCVGRERELSTLLGLFDQCVAEPVARAALVVGDAGVGKSRLRHELLRVLRGRGGAVEVWIGRGDPMSAGSPFGMIAPALRRLAGVLDGEPPQVRQKKLGARVARHLRGRDLTRVTWFLGELVGVPFLDDESVELRAARRDPMLMGDQMRRAFEDFLAAEAAAQPVLLVLDDLHWGDLPSVTFLDAALRNRGDLPWMVLGLARPEVHELFPALWRDRGVDEIRLDALTKRGSEKLVRAVLGDAVAGDVVEAIIDRSAGNAFYLEELIRAVAEGKGDVLPETVLTMAQARLDHLDVEARLVLRAAAIFGRVFWQGGLLALLDGATTPGELERRLAELCEREVIVRRSEGKFPGEREYAFRHALLREAAYAMLTDEDRSLGHRLAGQWLERAGEGEAIVLAEHLERGGEPGAAIAGYARAAEQALEGNDLAAAIARAERGVACGAAGEVLGALRLLQQEAELWRGNNAEGVRRGFEAMRSSVRGSAAWCRAAGQAAAASGRLADRGRLVLLADELLLLGAEGAESAAFTIACSRAAMSLLMLGLADLAEPLLGHLAHLTTILGTDDPVAHAWIQRAAALQGYFAEDVGAYLRKSEAVAASFERAGDKRLATLQRVSVGYAYLVLGAFAEAERTLREVIADARPLGLGLVVANAQHNLGMALAHQGLLEQAMAIEGAAERAFHLQGDRRLEAGSRMYVAAIHALAGDLDAGLRDARVAVEMAADLPNVRAHALATLAQLTLSRGRAAEAAPIAAEAMELVDQSAPDAGEALARLVFAETRYAAGDAGAARAAIVRARDRLHERAARISDRELRESFLQRVPENARTLALAAAWAPDAA